MGNFLYGQQAIWSIPYPKDWKVPLALHIVGKEPPTVITILLPPEIFILRPQGEPSRSIPNGIVHVLGHIGPFSLERVGHSR